MQSSTYMYFRPKELATLTELWFGKFRNDFETIFRKLCLSKMIAFEQPAILRLVFS